MPETCTMLESIIQFSCRLISGHQSIAFSNDNFVLWCIHLDSINPTSYQISESNLLLMALKSSYVSELLKEKKAITSVFWNKCHSWIQSEGHERKGNGLYLRSSSLLNKFSSPQP